MGTLYKLKLTSLKYVSSVDVPAQETAIARLLKRGTGIKIATTARVAKLSDELGLVFGWALTTKANGEDYFDLQGDAIQETDLIKVAAEWMSSGGAADTMHDREQDGRAVFCMPMTTEVAKAVYGDKIGGELGTYGLLVAIKPSPEDFAKFKSGELTGFSIDGMGERTAAKTQTRKSDDKRYLTDEQLGHQHEAFSYDGQEPWMSDATAEGAQGPHRHIVVRQPDGSLAVLADSGHTHTLTEQPKVIVVSDDTAVVSEAVAARAPQESPQAKKSPNVNLVNKDTTMDPTKELADLKDLKTKLEAKIAELEASLADATVQAGLTDADKAHLATLTGAEAKRFVALEKSAREAEVAKAKEADAVVVEFNGQQYRKSAGPAVIELAKAAKAQADMLAKQAEEIEKADIRKRSIEDLGGAPGTDETHDYIERSIAKGGGDATMIANARATLKGLRATSTIGKSAAGFGGAVEANDGPEGEFAAMVAKHAADNKCDERTARLAIVKTDKGRELYGEIEDLRKSKSLGGR